MPEWRIGMGDAANISVSAGNTRHVPIFGGEDFPFSAETSTQMVVRRSYSLSGAFVRIDTNATTSASTVRPRINAGDGNLAITIPAGTSGEFEHIGPSDALVAGDLINNRIINGGGGTITFTSINYNLQADANEPMIGSSRSGGATISDGGTNFHGLLGDHRAPTAENDAAYLFRQNTTMRDMQFLVLANTITTAITVVSRVNGGDGNQTFTVPATTSGRFEDLVNTDLITPGDEFNYQSSSPAGAGSTQIELTASRMIGGGRIQGMGDAGGTGIDFGVSRFFPIECGFGETAVEADVQVRAGVPFLARNFLVRVDFNAINGESTASFRVNGADSDLAVTIPASTSGDFEVLDEVVAVGSRDLLSLGLVTGGTQNTIRVTYLAFQQDQFPPLPPGEQQPDSAEWGIGRRVVAMAY